MLDAARTDPITRSHTVAFEGLEARRVEVQCAVTPGLPHFAIVGLADKAVSEARERVRTSLASLSIALPSARITINLSPADIPKEGNHFDLPIALALLAALQVVPAERVADCLALGELSLDGTLNPVLGALPAALAAGEDNRALLCPVSVGAEAAWVGATAVFGGTSLAAIIAHLNDRSPIEPMRPGEVTRPLSGKDFREVRGQERAKRALEIAAAGRHHTLLVGPPGSGKSMLAARLPSILPELTPAEALETSMVHSLAGLLDEGGISRTRPFRAPHHTASMPAIVGGGRRAQPGEVSLAHNGVLFLDELPEYPRQVLETLRQPIETGDVVVSRANAHVTYPCRFLLIAAANPCRCGEQVEGGSGCRRGPKCSADYLGRISAPLMDRFDLRLEVPPVTLDDLDLPAHGEPSENIAPRVAAARRRQLDRFESLGAKARCNADAEGDLLDQIARPDQAGADILRKAADKLNLSARGYHRVLRVARTIADLEGAPNVGRGHIAEALSFRLIIGQSTPS